MKIALVTGNIPEGSSDAVVSAVDDARSSAHDSAAIPHFTLASAESFALVHLLDIFPRIELPHQRHGLFGLLVRLHFILDDLVERNECERTEP